MAELDSSLRIVPESESHVRLDVTPALIHQIFLEFPEVELAYKRNVPDQVHLVAMVTLAHLFFPVHPARVLATLLQIEFIQNSTAIFCRRCCCWGGDEGSD